jgi:hypothetical protein
MIVGHTSLVDFNTSGNLFFVVISLSDELASNFAGQNPDRVLVLVTDRVASLNKRFDKLEDKIEEWRKEDREYYLQFEQKLNEHDGKLNIHELKLDSVCGEVNTLKNTISKWHSIDIDGFYQTLRDNKGKIVAGLLSLLSLIIAGILKYNR